MAHERYPKNAGSHTLYNKECGCCDIKDFTLGPGPSTKFLKDTLSRGLAPEVSYGRLT